MTRSKDKGSAWERQATNLLKEDMNDSFKKLPGSGAIGTQLGEALLTGDLSGRVPFIRKGFKIECKVGYGGAKQMTVKKEWFDKVKQEALDGNSHPALFAKFSGARTGVRYFVAFDYETFKELHDELHSTYEELNALYDKYYVLIDAYSALHDGGSNA